MVAYDFGIKETILAPAGRIRHGEVVPASTPADEVLARRPDGVFLSNGPGDPAALGGITGVIGALLADGGAGLRHLPRAPAPGDRPRRRAPTSCPSATTAATTPSPLATGAVEITSRTTTTRWTADSLAAADVTHVNLNDGVVEGIGCRDVPAFSVQYHPEAGPGPHDARYLFDEFET